MPPDPLDLVLFNQVYIFLQCACCLGSRSNKPLKVPSNSISEDLIFQNFLKGMPPDPPRFCMLRIPDVCSSHNYHVHYNVFVHPPFVNPRSTPDTDINASTQCSPTIMCVWLFLPLLLVVDRDIIKCDHLVVIVIFTIMNTMT